MPYLPPRDAGTALHFEDQEHPRSRAMNDLQRQLEEALATIRRLTRELSKEQARHAETTQAYNKTVSNMVAVARENALLSYELERLKRSSRSVPMGEVEGLPFAISADEAKAIRKAIARLHHPDVGGDEQRMKLWNAVLDRLDEGEML